jgi:hypothetical protein
MSRFHLSFTRDGREGSQVLRDPAPIGESVV